nr:immunoglobulin heavy chain junction region [Macaca mulatta]
CVKDSWGGGLDFW